MKWIGILAITLVVFLPVSRSAQVSAENSIVFEVTNNALGNSSIGSVRPDGTNQRVIANEGFSPSWANEGEKILFKLGGFGGLTSIVKRDENGLNTILVSGYSYFSPVASRDGSKIVFLQADNSFGATSDVLIMDASGENLRQLANGFAGSGQWHGDPDWLPDGTRLVFARETYLPGDNDYGLYLINQDGSGETRINVPLTGLVSPAFSPDGTKIAFAKVGIYSAAHDSIYIMNLDGTDLVPVPGTSGFHAGLSWSPDGSQLVFSMKREGAYNLYRVNIDGTNLVQLTNGTQDSLGPRWKRPTASQFRISGRVVTPDGRALRGAAVTIGNAATGFQTTTTTSSFGFFTFTNIPLGNNYILSVPSKRYRFASRTISVSSDILDLEFQGLE